MLLLALPTPSWWDIEDQHYLATTTSRPADVSDSLLLAVLNQTTLVELLQALRAERKLALAVCCSSRDAVDSVVHALAACKCFNLAVLHSDLAPHDIEQQLLQLKRRLPTAQQSSQEQMSQEQPLQEQPAAARQPIAEDQAEQQEQRQQQLMPPRLQQQGAAAIDTGQLVDGLPLPSVASSSNAQAMSDSRCLVLVTSDATLKGISKELTPLGLPLMIQFDLPASKELLQRRLAAMFGSSKERGRRSRQQVVIDFVVAGEVAAFRARERMNSALVLEMPVHVPDIFC